MPNRLIPLVIVLSCSVSALADYISDREAARKLVGDGKHEEALAAFLRMSETAASEAFHLRGKAYHYLNDPKSAAKDMEKALACAGSDGHFKAVVLGDLGSVYVSLQDDAKALDAYLKAQSCGDKGFHAYLSAVICVYPRPMSVGCCSGAASGTLALLSVATLAAVAIPCRRRRWVRLLDTPRGERVGFTELRESAGCERLAGHRGQAL